MDAILLKVDSNSYYPHTTYRQEVDLTPFATDGTSETTVSYLVNQNGENLIKQFFAQNKVEKNLFVTQSNSAHHLSYYMAKEASLYAATAKKNLQVINFDQHFDMQMPSQFQPAFACMNWGMRLLNEKIPYSVFGAGERAGNFDKRAKCLDSFVLCNRLRSNAPIYSLTSNDLVYLTVDMDVLCGAAGVKRTNYPHGDLFLEELLEILAQLPEKSVIAADITGLPPVIGPRQEVIEDYLDEIEKIGNILRSKFVL